LVNKEIKKVKLEEDKAAKGKAALVNEAINKIIFCHS
jgi:hypothetical protein